MATHGSRGSIAQALKEGYRFDMHSAGNGEVQTPKGEIYSIVDHRCDCPTQERDRIRLYGGSCKHEIWSRNVKPCEECGEQAWLCEYRLIWTIPTGEFVQEKPGRAWRCANGHTFEEST
jgi:hypothetical protein